MEKWNAVVLTCETAVSSATVWFLATSCVIRNPDRRIMGTIAVRTIDVLSMDIAIASSVLPDGSLQSGVGEGTP